MNKPNNNKTVGIIGDGQLALMLASAAHKLNINTICYGDNDDSPASYVTQVIKANLSQTETFNDFLNMVDVVTYETENILTNNIESLVSMINLNPSLEILKICQNRLYEKQMLKDFDISTTPYRNIESQDNLKNYAKAFNYKCILKTCCFGYDGKGQVAINNIEDVNTAWDAQSNNQSNGLVLEEKVPFDCELSIIAARDKNGTIVYYPLVENLHKNGILRLSIAPYTNPTIQENAEKIISTILSRFNYIGVMCVELFKKGNDLLVNEIAPRVHNSGHWTIEGCRVNQFENHMRAISGLAVLPPEPFGFSAMYNCISDLQEYKIVSALKRIENIDSINLHDYHKEKRAMRKLAHITINTKSKTVFESNLEKLNDIFKI